MSDGDSFLSYNSVQFIKVKNTSLALIYYGVCVLVLIYVIGFTVIYEKGYQLYDPITASTMVKLKGSGSSSQNGEVTVFDSYDLVKPPIVPGGSFIAASYIMTPNQTRGVCEDDQLACNCTTANSIKKCCKAGQYTENGRTTGTCSAGITGYCDIDAWCPLESPEAAPIAVDNVDQWTMFARVAGQFPTFGYHVSNTEGWTTISEPNGVNLFRLGDIVKESGYTWEEMLASKGGIFVVQMLYDCDLNALGDDMCLPSIKFFRLDDPNNSLSKGFNFRFANNGRNAAGTETRDLWKYTGMYLVFQVSGQAGQFDVATLGVTLGAGASFLAFATIFCDFLLTYCLRNRKQILKEKFFNINDDGDGEALLGSSVLPDENI